jgi:hypothetical protein
MTDSGRVLKPESDRPTRRSSLLQRGGIRPTEQRVRIALLPGSA